MIDIHTYNCKEQGECYLTYRRRLARENEQAKRDRVLHQSNEEWVKEYNKTVKGITLIELMIIMMIVGIVAAVVLPPVQKSFINQKNEISELREYKEGCK